MVDSEKRGRQASVDGFAHEHIVVGILIKNTKTYHWLIYLYLLMI